MITSADEFRQQFLDIQNNTSRVFTSLPSTEQRFIINANTRVINIPSEFGFLGVQNDHYAETIYFEIDRYFDKTDLSKHTCVVQFVNGKSQGIYPVTAYDIETVEGKIIFGWEIGNDATQNYGDLEFSVRFYTVSGDKFTYNFNTTSSKSNILRGINVKDSTQVSITPSETQAFINRINDRESELADFIELKKEEFTPKYHGDYDSDKQYGFLDIVYYPDNGCSYQNFGKNTPIGEDPTASENWEIISNGDVRLDKVSRQLAQTANEKADKTDLERERQRITNLATLTQGSTTGDAELIDGRVDDLGIAHSNIGEAVRSRNSQIAKELNLLNNWAFKGTYYKSLLFESGSVTNKNENYVSGTRIRSVLTADFSEHTSYQVEITNGYKVIRLDVPPNATSGQQFEMTAWITSSYKFTPRTGYRYRFVIAKTDEAAISASEAQNVKFRVLDTNYVDARVNKISGLEDVTYVILDFDQDITSLTDNRVALVNEKYGFPFSFVGVSNPSVTKELIGRGCDLSIYSNKAGKLPPASTINSDAEIDINAWDAYVKDILTDYNNAGFFNQVCWSCQGMKFGSALETALKKYGFKMARATASSIYIDGFTEDSFLVGNFQIRSGSALAKQQVTNAINNKQDICIFTHLIVETSAEDRGYDCTKETYTDFLDFIKEKVKLGVVKVVTFRDYYALHLQRQSYEYDYSRIMKTLLHNVG